MTDDMLHVMEWHNREKDNSPFSDTEMKRRPEDVRGWMAANDVDAALWLRSIKSVEEHALIRTGARICDVGGAAPRAAVSENAAAFAVDLAPVLDDIRAAGHSSLRATAAELTARGIRTRRGGK